ncbi:hypothetical protein E8E13_002848 [Curvularia kusanoi]|uniref:4'-phosphopantetheinyl transferase domain-containing protein n=1 Tax=Curvularia kusanoi TaxID=90978 RepID=A0A9P4W6T7_CURKU|nr:hypothetical protein E8E13_002848 [Curvularia kusanoi]
MPPRPFPFPLRIGTDICHIPRMRKLITGKDNGDKGRLINALLRRILTHPERVYFRNRFGSNEAIYADINPAAKFLAGRFAAKEACRKACDHLDKNDRGLKHIVILPVTAVEQGEHKSQRPEALVLHEPLQEPNSQEEPEAPFNMESLSGQLCEISISHDEDYATAVALVPRSLAALVTPSAAVSDPTITPAPNYELFKKQNNDRYMGWVQQNGIWSSVQCEAGATYYQDGKNWRCCGTTSAGCDIPQACVNGNLIFDGAILGSSTSLTFACTDVYNEPIDASFTVCNTAFMYENSQDSSPKTNPEAAKTTTRASARGSATAAATTSDSFGSFETDEPTVGTHTTKKKSKSKAWIAGAVIGPLIGLAIVAFLAFFCIRRKKKNKAIAASAAAVSQTTRNPQPQPAAPAVSTPAPQYYPPPMQQQGAGAAPFGVADAKPNVWAPQPQSPVSQVSTPNTLSTYGNQYPQQGGYAAPAQPVYNAPSPSMSPPPPQAYENNVNYNPAHEARPFSSELDGSAQIPSSQPKQN